MCRIFSKAWFPAVIVLSVVLLGCRTGRGPDRPPPDERPPEFAPFADDPPRLPQRRRPLEDFERTATIAVTSPTGRPFLLKNTRQAIWGAAAAEIRYLPVDDTTHVIDLIPESPWRMPSLFDNISLWIRDGGEGAAPGAHALDLHLRDGQGRLQELRLSYRPSDQWQMVQLRLEDPLDLPVTVEKIQWVLPERTTSPRRILLEGLTLYQEVLSRIPTRVSYVRPFGYAPAFAPLRENSVTLNFPTADLAFKPVSREDRFLVNLEPLGNDEHLFTATSPSGEVLYRIRPQKGGPRVDVKVGPEEWVTAWSGPRILTAEAAPTLRFSRVNGAELTLQYTDGITFSLFMSNKTLVISVESIREDLAGLDLGSFKGGRQVTVPFLRSAEGKPFPVRFVDRGDTATFLTVFPDWWYSMAGEFLHGKDEDHVGHFIYPARWRGGRNLFRERLYFTASPYLGEVLPSGPNPQAMYTSRVTESLWPPDQRVRHALLNLEPSETIWDDRHIARRPNGEWLTLPERKGVVMKTTLAENLSIPRLLQKQVAPGYSPLYLPEVTSHGPWAFTDYDNRVVGAGTFAQTYAEIGALLQQTEAEWGGAAIGRGGAEIFWAGLVSGFVPNFTAVSIWEDPWIPHTAWNLISQSSRLLGVGPISSFSAKDETEDQDFTQWLNRSLASQVAYGAPGRLPEAGLSGLQKTNTVNLIRALQQTLYGKSAERIAYWDSKRFVDLASAITSGAIDQNQIYIRLDDQSEVWVNGSKTRTWTRRIGASEWTLPPFGFLVRGPDRLIIHLPHTPDIKGMTLVDAPEVSWFSSPHEVKEERGMRFQGAIGIESPAKGNVRLDIHEWFGEASFKLEKLPINAVASVTAVDQAGNSIPTVRMTQSDGYWVLSSSADLKTVWLSETVQGDDRNLSP